MPVKTDSPLGFEAWKWAEEFFKNVDYVRLEKEDDERGKTWIFSEDILCI